MTNEELKKQFDLNDPYQIAKYIKAVTKTTPVKAYIRGYLSSSDLKGLEYYGDPTACVVFGEAEEIKTLLHNKAERITSCRFECDRRNSAIPLLNLAEVDARIEPGAIIREGAHIHKNAVIMMGAAINIGAIVGEGTMIDMNAVIGARGTIGKNCHIGAGAVIAGVLEPPSKEPVVIEDNVVVGANAVVLEGVRVGQGAVIAAGSIVTEDVSPQVVVAGAPARIVKDKDKKTEAKTEILDDLRG